MKHIGDLDITETNANQFDEFDEFDGWVYVHSGEFKPKNLTRINGWLTIHSGAVMEAPALQRIDGWLYVYGEAKLTAPVLSEITEGKSIRDGAIINTPLV